MKTIHVLALGFGALLLATPAFADKDHKEKGHDKDKKPKAAELVKEAKVTIEQAIKTATEKAPGTVVEAELEREHGKTVWEVEIVGADGGVTEVVIDAADGTVLENKKKGEKHGEKH
ncbi:MAG: PepSY domain-containing protein [Nitrospiraceae bacterium]